MARSVEGEYEIQFPSLVTAGMAFIAGLITQSFIIFVNVIDWLKGRPVTPVDQILTSLGATRICFHSFSLLEMFSVIFFQNDLNSYITTFIYLTVNSSNLSDIWLTTLFSVVFCLKISNFHNAFFLRLKLIISRSVVHLIIASVPLSISFISMFLWINSKITSSISEQNLTMNNTQTPPTMHIYIFMTMGNSVPFLIYFTSSLLLITSLCQHMKKMRCNNNVTTNLDTYYQAVQFMTFCLICFILRIGTNLVVLYYCYVLDIVWLFIIWNSFPTLHSIYLIHRTNKLKDKFSRILKRGTNCLFDKRGSDPNSRDVVETIAP